MKAKANVLQVMDTIIHEISWHSDIRAAELSEARAAVAELIEAANYAYPPGDYSQDAHGYAVRAALDRVGGAK